MKSVYAELAKQSYERHASADTVGNFVCDKRYGQANSSVYVNQGDKRVAYVIRGTNPTNPEDLLSDAAVLVGKIQHTRRYREIRRRFLQLQKDFPGYKIDAIGHSLGGSLALALLEEYPYEVDGIYIYNPGAGFGTTLKGLKNRFLSFIGKKKYKTIRNKTHIYHTKGDPISLLSHAIDGHIEVNEADGSNPHSIDNWVQPSEKLTSNEVAVPSAGNDPEEGRLGGVSTLHLIKRLKKHGISHRGMNRRQMLFVLEKIMELEPQQRSKALARI